jgi:hypothetical protein
VGSQTRPRAIPPAAPSAFRCCYPRKVVNAAMPDRLRHCVECPDCCTRYLPGFSPYRNGSYLVSLVTDSAEEYKLICSCCRPPVCSRWNWSELKTYGVSHAAYERGYGRSDEIWLLRQYPDRDTALLNLNSIGEARRKAR